MLKECVVLNDQVINIGPWDYQVQQVEVGQDDTGQPIYEDRQTNPLPDGAIVQEIEIVEGKDGGLYPADYVAPETDAEKIARLDSENVELKQAIADLTMTMATIVRGGQ